MTSTSSRPYLSRCGSTSPCSVLLVGHVRRHALHLEPARAQLLGRRLQLLRPPRRDRQPVAVLAERPRDRQPDPARTARDQRRLLRQRVLLRKRSRLSAPLGSANRGGHPIGGPSTMPPVSRKTLVAMPLPLAVALVAGCGGSDNGTGSRSKPAPAASDFPSAAGPDPPADRALGAKGEPGTRGRAGGRCFHLGTNRFPFGVFTAGREQITDAAGRHLRRAGQGRDGPGDRPLPGADRGPHHQARLPGQDHRGRSRRRPGRLRHRHPLRQARPLGVRRPDQERRLLPVQPAARRPTRSATTRCPQVGQKAPVVHTPDRGEVSDISQIDTRVPPDDMHSDDFADVLGKKPVVLLFATPALCQSRVCGPVTDVAEQVKQRVRRPGRLHPPGGLQQQPASTTGLARR